MKKAIISLTTGELNTIRNGMHLILCLDKDKLIELTPEAKQWYKNVEKKFKMLT